MYLLRLVISTIVIISSCEASGFGHLAPAVKSIPVVRYSPFYSFPNGVRSIHAVLPAVAPALPVAPAIRAYAPAPVLPAAVAAPVLPAPPPLFPARVLPSPAFPAPIFRSPFLPAPIPAPLPAPLPAPAFAPAPVFSSHIPAAPVLAKFSPIPNFPAPQFYASSVSTVPFSPIVRPVAPAVLPAPAPAFPAPVFAPSPYGLTRTIAYPPPAPLLPAPLIKHAQAWK